MSEKKTSGVRTDLSLSEFEAKMGKVAPKSRNTISKAKNFFGKVTDFLSSLGLFPVLKTNSKGHGHAGGVHHTPSDFKESYRVEAPPPRRRTHEEWVIDEMAHEAYHRMVDGKGDHDCDHEH